MVPSSNPLCTSALGRQMPSWGVWDVGKTKISCKEDASVQYRAHYSWAPPHALQQITVCSWSHAVDSGYIIESILLKQKNKK